MKNYFLNAKGFLLAHKVLSSIGMIALLYGGYAWYSTATDTSGETRYVTTTAEKGTIMSTVTGTGQIVTRDTLDIKPSVSGDIIL